MSAARFFRRPAVVLILGLCLIGAAMGVLSRLASGPAAAPKRVPLPHLAGAETSPAFSPDGVRLAFAGRDAVRKTSYRIYVRMLAGDRAATQLTSGPANDFGPAWSPDGASIAFLRVDGNRALYMVVPSAGGDPRQVAEFEFPDADSAPAPQSPVCWARDGQSLYVVAWVTGQAPFIAAVPAAGGAPHRITQPALPSKSDSAPAISPDGTVLAFVRQSSDRAGHHGDEDGADIFLSDLSGGDARRLTFDNAAIHGIAWSADGRDLVYAASRAGDVKLWRIAASGGSPRHALAGAKQPSLPAVAATGRRLAFAEKAEHDDIWRIDLTAADPASTARLLIHSSGRELAPRWSPDGTRIVNVSTQSGGSELWVSDADGNHRAQITHLNPPFLDSPRWSPDGRAIVFALRGMGSIDVNRVAADGRTQPQHIPLPEDSHELSWSRDGKSVYFVAMAQIWKARADGQQRQKLTSNWGDDRPEESADGQSVVFRRNGALWRIPAAGGAEEKVIAPEHDAHWPAYRPSAAGLYYLELDRDDRTVALCFYDFSSKKSRDLVRLPAADPSTVHAFDVSPDGHYLLYPAVDRAQTSLVLMENFR
jgi:Tol biopolymer transport system component